jgi:sporulation protein YlmC with PRC-barrel domain
VSRRIRVVGRASRPIATGVEDLGAQIASLALQEGTSVYDDRGERIGVVDEVLLEPPGGIFEGVIVHTLPLPGHHLRATPDQIAEIRERGVLLTVGREALREEDASQRRRAESPPVEPPLERFARRVWDRVAGHR